MLNVLLIAPGQTGIDASPEISMLTELFHTKVLSGQVTAGQVYEAAKAQRDIIHWAAHGDENGIQLSDGLLNADEVAQIGRRAGARLMFFNSCRSARVAIMTVDDGAEYAVHTTVDIPDEVAWRMPVMLYQTLAEQERIGAMDIPAAFWLAANGSGKYGIYSKKYMGDRDQLNDKVAELDAKVTELYATVTREMRWQKIAVPILFAITVAASLSLHLFM